MTEIFSPSTLPEALRLLQRDPALRPLAGCTDLMVTGPEQRAELAGVIDLLRVPELEGIRETESGIEIGAVTTFRKIAESAAVRQRYPILAQAASVVGGWQIQNRATLGGNIVNASPAGDSLPVLLALGATVLVAGATGEREIAYGAFHTGYRRTALAPGELLVRVRLPNPPAGSEQRFRKVGTREAQAISKVVVAMTARLREGVIDSLRLAAGSVAATPVLLPSVAKAVLGRAPDAMTAERAAAAASESVTPIDDVRSTAEYRRWVLGRVVRRMVRSLGRVEAES